jgi:hypothetical protein
MRGEIGPLGGVNLAVVENIILSNKIIILPPLSKSGDSTEFLDINQKKKS